ncbi:MAG: elongation factor Ts [Gammaproteobacteria bacterium]|nr:elongation factor Ts [Gammaproteobacteria bacterium]MBT8135213.1 elongation factor Ts [Gammaproteobacteria bacterium]NNJ48987.1 elongation factor Ts [Gammaproteobacteria bacterium]
MQITASMVKELRERTGSGMMECKKALQEAGGDIDVAIENMRKAGMAKADKKSGRVAAEGRVVIKISDDGKSAAVVEVNCETDFVSGGDDFLSFVDAIATTALKNKPADIAALSEMTLEGSSETVEEARKAKIAKIGENMQLRRFELLETDAGTFGSYLHGSRMGVLVEMENGNDELIKDIAMHIAASNPLCVSEAEVPADVLEKEKEILRAQALESGKPADIVEKMLTGRIRKYLAEITLLGQSFVKDPDKTVETLLSDAGATVNRFVRYEVGEGIEKKQENFADEVMAQVNG